MNIQAETIYVLQRKHRRKNSEWRDYMYFSDHDRAITQYHDMLARPIHHDLQSYPKLRVIFKEVRELELISNDQE